MALPPASAERPKQVMSWVAPPRDGAGCSVVFPAGTHRRPTRRRGRELRRAVGKDVDSAARGIGN